MACGVVVVGASCVGAVDADGPSAGEELRWQPHVPPGREISPTAFPDSERHSWSPTRRLDRTKTFKFRAKSKGKIYSQRNEVFQGTWSIIKRKIAIACNYCKTWFPLVHFYGFHWGSVESGRGHYGMRFCQSSSLFPLTTYSCHEGASH